MSFKFLAATWMLKVIFLLYTRASLRQRQNVRTGSITRARSCNESCKWNSTLHPADPHNAITMKSSFAIPIINTMVISKINPRRNSYAMIQMWHRESNYRGLTPPVAIAFISTMGISKDIFQINTVYWCRMKSFVLN